MTKSAAGGKPAETAWFKQNGQCSKWVACSAGAGDCVSCAASTITILLPATVQISIHAFGAFLAAATAWEIEGASDAIKIAKQAIQQANLCVDFFILMVERALEKVANSGQFGSLSFKQGTHCAAYYSRAAGEWIAAPLLAAQAWLAQNEIYFDTIRMMRDHENRIFR